MTTLGIPTPEFVQILSHVISRAAHGAPVEHDLPDTPRPPTWSSSPAAAG